MYCWGSGNNIWILKKMEILFPHIKCVCMKTHGYIFMGFPPSAQSGETWWWSKAALKRLSCFLTGKQRYFWKDQNIYFYNKIIIRMIDKTFESLFSLKDKEAYLSREWKTVMPHPLFVKSYFVRIFCNKCKFYIRA